MFDPKVLLEQMMRGANQQNQPSGQGGIGDILSQLGKQFGQPSGSTQGGSPMGGLEDLIRNMTGGQQSGQPRSGQDSAGQAPAGGNQGGFNLEDLIRNLSPGNAPAQSERDHGGYDSGRHAAPSASQKPSGGLGDILGQFQGKDGGGGLLDTLGKMLQQASEGAREGAGKISDRTGAGQAFEKMSGGRSPEELMKQLQDLIANNKLGAGAALGGLGALVLGTQTGRSIAVGAAKIGAIALIGGLAYKALQNYQQGRPLVSDGSVEPEPAPRGSGFEESAVSDDAAIAYLRAMIAAAAADGRLDASEQERITANLTQAGMDRHAEEFIAREINQPARIDELVAAVSNEREAIQLYTAARLAIDPDTHAEQAFLHQLAGRLGIDNALARHVDKVAGNLAG